MSYWSIRSRNNKTETGSVASATSTMTAVPSSTTADLAGSWVELVASTGFDSHLLILMARGVGTSAVAAKLDVAVGASGSEEIIIPDLSIEGHWNVSPYESSWPLFIPAGSRIAVRSTDSAVTSYGHLVGLYLFGNQFSETPAVSGKATKLSTGTYALQVDPGGTANTKGSWIEMTASTSEDHAGLVLVCTHGTNSAMASGTGLFDIAFGSSGSEEVIVADMFVDYSALERCPSGISGKHLPLFVPAGTRIAMRGQSTITNAIDRRTFWAVYGT